MTRKSKLHPPLGDIDPERPAERQTAMESIHLSEEEAPELAKAFEHSPGRSADSTRAMRRSQRLSDNRWLLWVDSRGRITIPKALRDLEDWRDRDVIGFELLRDTTPGFIMRNLSRDLRRALAELETLRGARPRSEQAKRVAELGRIVATLADHFYPVDQVSGSSASAQQTFARSQAEQRMRREGVKDPIDAILMALEIRKLMHKAFP